MTEEAVVVGQRRIVHEHEDTDVRREYAGGSNSQIAVLVKLWKT